MHEFPARQRFAHIHRDSASLRYCAAASCVAQVLLCPCFTLLPHACLRFFKADLAVADLPLFARCHPAAVERRGRSPVGVPVPSTPSRSERKLEAYIINKSRLLVRKDAMS